MFYSYVTYLSFMLNSTIALLNRHFTASLCHSSARDWDQPVGRVGRCHANRRRNWRGQSSGCESLMGRYSITNGILAGSRWIQDRVWYSGLMLASDFLMPNHVCLDSWMQPPLSDTLQAAYCGFFTLSTRCLFVGTGYANAKDRHWNPPDCARATEVWHFSTRWRLGAEILAMTEGVCPKRIVVEVKTYFWGLYTNIQKQLSLCSCAAFWTEIISQRQTRYIVKPDGTSRKRSMFYPDSTRWFCFIR